MQNCSWYLGVAGGQYQREVYNRIYFNFSLKYQIYIQNLQITKKEQDIKVKP